VCGMPEGNSEDEQRNQAHTERSEMPLEAGEGPEHDRTRESERPAGDERDPRGKESALQRLHGASDEVLAVFEQTLREDASAAGASEQELRDAQAEHPEHA
jgi:hypothetical protein